MTRSAIADAREEVIRRAKIVANNPPAWCRQNVTDLIDAVLALEEIEPEAIGPDVGAYRHDATSTSRGAAFKARLLQGSVRHRVVVELYNVAIAAGETMVGLTDDDLERRLRVPHTTLSSARNHLVNTGWIEDSGLERYTRGQRPAIVWRLTALGHTTIADELRER